MALTVRYCNPDLATGSNDGTSEANAWQSLATMAANYAAGQHVYIKRCASRIDEGAITLGTSATANAPIIIEGYKTTIGDGRDNGIANFFQCGAYLYLSGTGQCARYIDIEHGDNAYCMRIDGSLATDCRFKGTHTSPNCVYVATNSELRNSYIDAATLSTTGAVYCYRSAVVGCHIKSVRLGIYLQTSYNAGYAIGNVIDGGGGSTDYCGIEIAGGSHCVVMNNTIYNVYDGLIVVALGAWGDKANMYVANNIIYTCARYGISVEEATDYDSFHFVNNFVGACTTATTNGMGETPLFQDKSASFGVISLSADPFTDAASDDFTLNNTAGGGAVCRGAGAYTDKDLDGTAENFGDGGALQVELSAGGGGTVDLPDPIIIGT